MFDCFVETLTDVPASICYKSSQDDYSCSSVNQRYKTLFLNL